MLSEEKVDELMNLAKGCCDECSRKGIVIGYSQAKKEESECVCENCKYFSDDFNGMPKCLNSKIGAYSIEKDFFCGYFTKKEKQQ